MPDSRVELIAENLRTTLHGKSIVYNGVTHTTTCERQRFVREINNRYPFIELCGPWVEVVNRTICKADVKIFFVAELREARINDEYESGKDILPISQIVGNVPAQIQKMVRSDITRGGNAFLTTWDDFGYYIDTDSNISELVIYQIIIVDAAINIDDPYLGG